MILVKSEKIQKLADEFKKENYSVQFIYDFSEGTYTTDLTDLKTGDGAKITEPRMPDEEIMLLNLEVLKAQADETRKAKNRAIQE